jgi:ribosomal protein S18 acetylase RimI-like enzyme
VPDSDNVDELERMAAALPGMWRARVRSCGGVVHDVDGLAVCLTGVPDEPFNPTLVVRTPDDVDGALVAAAEHCTGIGLTLGVDLEPSVHRDVRDAAQRGGFSLVESRPGMALDISDLRGAPDPPGIDVRRVQDVSTLAKVHAADSATFGVDVQLIKAFLPAAVLEDPQQRVVAAFDGEEVVGAGESMLADGVLGVFGIATIPTHRRRGIAAAVTSRLIEERADDADLAVLQASELGLRVYERLGFHAMSTWEVWSAPSSAPVTNEELGR